MTKLLSRTFAALATVMGLAGSALVAAQDAAPDQLVKNVSTEVIDIIRADKAIQGGDMKRISEVIEAKIVPHFNFGRMTALAVGPNWRRATPEQQKALSDQFRTLLVRTYSTGLSSYRDEKIIYKPMRIQPADTEVTVRSEIRRAGGEPVTIDYSMERGTGPWKVYDVVIGGVSLVTTYRDSFREEVRATGIDGLIKSLVAKNQQMASK